mmetsp:Transcript_31942/g.67163  ORF Transcript_31942/g.67163 Transcript_31942/m.67163 type:complete len:84 (-) Transcript_31942:1232-1483(-)
MLDGQLFRFWAMPSSTSFTTSSAKNPPRLSLSSPNTDCTQKRLALRTTIHFRHEIDTKQLITQHWQQLICQKHKSNEIYLATT